MTLIRREYPTPVGPVDLLCRDAGGVTVAVEVKRRGEIDGVEQLTRYLEFLNRDDRLAPVRGLLAAQIVRPQARTLAEDRGIGWRALSHVGIVRSATAFRGHPGDVLRRVLDIACLAVNAILRVDLQARVAAVVVA